MFNKVEGILEGFFWNFKFIILLSSFGFVITSAITLLMGTLETFVVGQLFVDNLLHHGIHFEKAIYNEILTTTIVVIDDFLLGIVLFIFGVGVYDLFISRLDPADKQEDIRADWLVFGSIEELKAVLAQVILMIIIVNLLKYVVEVKFTTSLDILYLGITIMLVALAIKLSYGGHPADISTTKRSDRIKLDREFIGDEPKHEGS